MALHLTAVDVPEIYLRELAKKVDENLSIVINFDQVVTIFDTVLEIGLRGWKL